MELGLAMPAHSRFGLLFPWAVLAFVACSSADPPSHGLTPNAAGTGGGGGTAEDPIDIPLGGTGGTGGTTHGGETCAVVEAHQTERALRLYIMLDRSSSMLQGGRWDAVNAGLKAFLGDTRSEGITVALNVFPKTLGSAQFCQPGEYETPIEAYGELPAHASALLAALAAESPSGANTPTYPALAGALAAALTGAKAFPEASSAVLLVTDGAPLGACKNDTTEIAGLAAAALRAAHPVFTYVVGLDNTAAFSKFANAIAVAGGSERAILVGDGNADAFATALRSVRGTALPCEIVLPVDLDSGKVAFDRVNVLYTSEGEPKPEVIKQTEDCTGKSGWRYDDPKAPTRILLCESTCDALRDGRPGTLEIQLGCQTIRH